MTVNYDIATARLHVYLGEKQVEEQRRLIADLEAQGAATLLAKELLADFEASLRAHKATYAFLMRK